MTAWMQRARDVLFRRQRSYQEIFISSPVGREVLADLEQFCRATESTFHPDPRIAANLDGRREVWLHIQQLLQIDQETLWEIHLERRRQQNVGK